ncbi:hypothetical protein CFP56_022111 [Quercus suber]|uniref:Uncharacterized protein n=1 Tax=Quercus suber TaxID=58331 RepID=A0AAW0LZF3_QUESU
MMSAMSADIGRIADALTENNKTVCLDELFEMVQTIPGFDDDLIIEAYEYLSFDERRAMTFMKLNERIRKKWLLKRLRGQASCYCFSTIKQEQGTDQTIQTWVLTF